MTGRKFFLLLGVLFAVVLASYLLTTPRIHEIQLIGVVDGNEVIVSPQVSGRMIRLLVDEGSKVEQGQLIAELDPAELEAQVAQDTANINSLEARVHQSYRTLTWMDEQTKAALKQAEANMTAAEAQLEQARANLEPDEINYKRTMTLFGSGVVSAQSRDQASSALKASQANMKSLEDQVRAQKAALAVARANREHVQVQQADLASTEAQLAQARAAESQAETQLGDTKIYAPISGIVSLRVAKQGEVVTQGGPIVVLVDVDHLWVRADIPETYVDSVHFGQELKVRLPSGDVLEGQVFFKGVEGDFATQRDVSRMKRDIRTFAIKVAVPNRHRRLFTGMTATVLFSPPAEKKHWWTRLWVRTS